MGLDCSLLLPLYRCAAAIEAGSLDWLDGFAGPVLLALAREDAETHRAVDAWGQKVKLGSLETVEQQRPGLYAALNDGLVRVKTQYVQQCGVDDEAYWRTHDAQQAARYHEAREKSWKGLSEVLGL